MGHYLLLLSKMVSCIVQLPNSESTSITCCTGLQFHCLHLSVCKAVNLQKLQQEEKQGNNAGDTELSFPSKITTILIDPVLLPKERGKKRKSFFLL